MRSVFTDYTAIWLQTHLTAGWRYALATLGIWWVVLVTVWPMLVRADLEDNDIDQRSPWYLVAVYHVTWHVRNAVLYLYGMCRDPHRYLRGYRHSRVGRILLSLRRRDECVVRWYDLGSALKVEAMRA